MPHAPAGTSRRLGPVNLRQSCVPLAISSGRTSRVHGSRPQDAANPARGLSALHLAAKVLRELKVSAAVILVSHGAAPCRRASSASSPFGTRGLASVAWEGPVPLHRGDDLTGVLHAAAIDNGDEFGPPDLAQTAWACAALAYQNAPLLAAIAQTANCTVGSFGDQELVLMADAYSHGEGTLLLPDLWPRLSSIATAAATRLPGRADGREWKAFAEWLLERRLDRLGWLATDMVLHRGEADGGLGIAPPAIESRGVAQSMAKHAASDKVTTVLFYTLTWPSAGGKTFQGELVRTQGPPEPESVRSREWRIRATRLPLSRWVDRACCSEFRALDALCQLIEDMEASTGLGSLMSGNSKNNVEGTVSLWVFGAPPCLSCLAAMRQFQGRFPGVRLHVAVEAASSSTNE
eukprot:gnl/TRDRNA2_/TRDRNA2_174913_c0_seq1.p1 gnl/TRDRNA2_/TRDRNA2_174913_c0~~gnl/TRDRNA2_/TRDRNA2_174913_c0_seq1.p1  ORF type:complete len:406 (+),score=55.69 gnl/TRDRNA2_/TRDRNA2_174913_c0_seq1:504-1721(+)